jgi:hypothetical protein
MLGQDGLQCEVKTFPDQLNNVQMCLSNIIITKLSKTKREATLFILWRLVTLDNEIIFIFCFKN